MANQNDTVSTSTKQCNSHLYDELIIKFSQLESIIDLLAVSLHPDNNSVLKKSTQHDSVCSIEELVREIKSLCIESIKYRN